MSARLVQPPNPGNARPSSCQADLTTPLPDLIDACVEPAWDDADLASTLRYAGESSDIVIPEEFQRVWP